VRAAASCAGSVRGAAPFVIAGERVADPGERVRWGKVVVGESRDRADQPEQRGPAMAGRLGRWESGARSYPCREQVDGRGPSRSVPLRGRLLTDCKRTVQQSGHLMGCAGYAKGKPQVRTLIAGQGSTLLNRLGGGSRFEPWQEVIVLDVFGAIATVMVRSRPFVEYLHLARFDGRWLIVNALYAVQTAPDA
jgi:hypothetical protein